MNVVLCIVATAVLVNVGSVYTPSRVGFLWCWITSKLLAVVEASPPLLELAPELAPLDPPLTPDDPDAPLEPP
jgi:hypothetical protein